MELDSSVEQVKKAALGVLEEAEQKIRALEALLVEKKAQLEQAREQVFRLRQIEIEVGQWKNKAANLEKQLLKLSEEKERLIEQIQAKEAVRKHRETSFECCLYNRRKLNIIAPVSIEVLPLVYATKEIHVGNVERKKTLSTLSVCSHSCVSIFQEESSKEESFHTVQEIARNTEYQQWRQKRYSGTSITSLSSPFSLLDSTVENGIDPKSEISNRCTVTSQNAIVDASNQKNDIHCNTLQTVDISSFYSLHSSLMIAVGRFMLLQLERHTFCWKGMDELTLEDFGILREVVNNILYCWDVSHLAKYELYDGKWVSCFRSVWKQVMMQFDNQQAVLRGENFLFFGIILFCCFYNFKAEWHRQTKQYECERPLDEKLYVDHNMGMEDSYCSKVSGMSKLSPQSYEEEAKHFLTIRQAMEAILCQLIVANDKVVRKCHHWKKQAHFFKNAASSYQNEWLRCKAQLSKYKNKHLLLENYLVGLKDKVIQLRQMRCELEREMSIYRSCLNSFYSEYTKKHRYLERFVKEHQNRTKGLEADNESLCSERTKWMKEQKHYQTTIQQLQLEIHNWETQVKRLHGRLAEDENVRKQLQQNIFDREQREIEAKAEYESFLERKELEISEAQECICALRKRLEQTESQLVESRKREYLLETKIETLQQALESTKDELVVELVDTKIRLAQTYEAMEALRLSKRGTQGTGRGVPWTG